MAALGTTPIPCRYCGTTINYPIIATGQTTDNGGGTVSVALDIDLTPRLTHTCKEA